MKKNLQKLMEALEEKKEMKMDENGSKAKMDVLKEIHKMASDKAKDGIAKGMQEVKVAAPSKEGLVEGLEMAKELAENSEMLDELMEKDEEDKE